jgi:hypothetical protein
VNLQPLARHRLITGAHSLIRGGLLHGSFLAGRSSFLLACASAKIPATDSLCWRSCQIALLPGRKLFKMPTTPSSDLLTKTRTPPKDTKDYRQQGKRINLKWHLYSIRWTSKFGQEYLHVSRRRPYPGTPRHRLGSRGSEVLARSCVCPRGSEQGRSSAGLLVRILASRGPG